jgi:SAM-dependent methyltransferase
MGKETKCRLCKGSKLEMFLDMGFTPPSDSFLTEDQLDQPEEYYPLRVCLCNDCGHMQLDYTASGEVLYCRNYPYDNSTSASFRQHFIDMSSHICSKFSLKPDSLVVDVGSNVGVLLSGFKEHGVRVLGVDPAENLAEKANRRGIETIAKFFDSRLAGKIISEKGRASIITATNVFAHIPNIHEFAESVFNLLQEDGVFVFEVPYALIMIRDMLYDTIYHEHLGYISVKPIVPFFEKFNLTVFDIEMVETHGGSLRVFVCKKGTRAVSQKVKDHIKKEEDFGLHSMQTLKKFADDVKKHRSELISLFYKLKSEGRKIVGVGAPAKGNTLLNYCRIDTDVLDYITERAETKIGLYTPGTHIPIFPDEKLLQDKPDYALLLSWNLAPEIMRNLADFTKQGGKFIIPIPQPRIVKNEPQEK